MGTVCFNIPAIAFAVVAVYDNDSLEGLAVKLTDLFSMADILTITLVVPVFAGLWEFATPYGCLLGMFSGIITIMLWGWIEFGTFMAGMEMITLMCFGNVDAAPSSDGAPACGFYSRRASMLFPSLVLITGLVTYVVSWMERSIILLARVVNITQGAPQESPRVEDKQTPIPVGQKTNNIPPPS